jgi:hypothetical protein
MVVPSLLPFVLLKTALQLAHLSFDGALFIAPILQQHSLWQMLNKK